jgi:hypothetical protein
MATAFEVEAGRLSLDQARSTLKRHGLLNVEAINGPAQVFEDKDGVATTVGEHLLPADSFDPLAAWRSLPPEIRERIGAAAIAAAVCNLGAHIAIEQADPIAHGHFHVAEGEALSLIFELVNINVLGGDDTTLPPRPDLRPLGIRQCRVCGCTDDYACDGGCEWVEPDLCSSCITSALPHSIANHGEQR